MDAARFDTLTRSLGDRLTRRRGFALLGGYALGAHSLLERGDARKKRGKKRKGKKRKPKAPPCAVSRNDAGLTSALTVTLKDYSLTATTQLPRDGSTALTNATTIRHKQAMVLTTTVTRTPQGITSVEVVYGKGFTGIERAQFSIFRSSVRGSIDGRGIVPFSAQSPPSTIAFQDGEPAPTMAASPGIFQRIEQISARAKAQTEACAAEPTARAADVGSEDHDSGECIACLAGCVGAMGFCGHAIPATCGPIAAACFIGAPACYAACVAVEVAICTAAGFVCGNELCGRGACCAVECHPGDGSNLCCEEGQACLRPGVCCPAGQAACQGRFCCPSANRCLPDGTCCVQPDFPCGQNCCGPFTDNCCNGVCCNGECINGVCCTAPSRRCGNQCCANTCCNTVCCAPGQSCHPQTGQCAVICRPDQVFCPGNGQCCDGECCFRPSGNWLCLTRCVA